MLVRSCEPTPPLISNEAHPGKVDEPVVVAKAAGQQIYEYWIELDPGDIAEPEQFGRQQITAAAHPNHRRATALADRIGQIRDVIPQEVELRHITVEAVHRARRGAVYIHFAFSCSECRHGGRRPPHLGPPFKTWTDADAGKRIPPNNRVEFCGVDRALHHRWPEAIRLDCSVRDCNNG